jgi:predicted transcriptional regulator
MLVKNYVIDYDIVDHRKGFKVVKSFKGVLIKNATPETIINVLPHNMSRSCFNIKKIKEVKKNENI